MDAATYQQTFDTLVTDGFRLTSVCGYSEGTGSRFSAVWVRCDGPVFQARHGLSAADYQATFDSLVAQGFRLTSISGYAETGQARYAAIWEQRPGPDWQARHGLSRQQYQQAFDEMAAQGYVLAQVSGYRVGVDVQFAARWEKLQAGFPPGAGLRLRRRVLPGLAADETQTCGRLAGELGASGKPGYVLGSALDRSGRHAGDEVALDEQEEDHDRQREQHRGCHLPAEVRPRHRVRERGKPDG